jgi:chitin disaccharide deacetylase
VGASAPDLARMRKPRGTRVDGLLPRVHTAGMDGHNSESAGTVPAGRSSALLGYPPDARLLIVNADDLGMYHAINAAVIDSIENGIASSCSLMVPCPWAVHAMQLLRQRPQIPFGIHLTLVCDTTVHRWGPLTAKEQVPSLLDGAGALFAPGKAPQLLVQARIDEVELEFRAQVDAVLDAGLTPTHLDFHCLADGGRDDIFDLTVALASEYGLAVRVWLDRGRRKLRRRGLPVTDNDFLDSFSLDLDGKPTRYDTLGCCALCRPASTSGRCTPAWATRSRRPSTAVGACAGPTTSSSPRRRPANSYGRRESS